MKIIEKGGKGETVFVPNMGIAIQSAFVSSTASTARTKLLLRYSKIIEKGGKGETVFVPNVGTAIQSAFVSSTASTASTTKTKLF